MVYIASINLCFVSVCNEVIEMCVKVLCNTHSITKFNSMHFYSKIDFFANMTSFCSASHKLQELNLY